MNNQTKLFYSVGEDGTELISNHPFSTIHTSTGQVSFDSNVNIVKTGPFSRAEYTPYVELPKGTLFKLLGFHPQPMTEGEMQ